MVGTLREEGGGGVLKPPEPLSKKNHKKEQLTKKYEPLKSREEITGP